MAHPKRRHSTQRSRKRRTHDKVESVYSHLATDGNKGGFSHRVDPITGYYKGKQIVALKVKNKKTDTPEA